MFDDHQQNYFPGKRLRTCGNAEIVVWCFTIFLFGAAMGFALRALV